MSRPASHSLPAFLVIAALWSGTSPRAAAAPLPRPVRAAPPSMSLLASRAAAALKALRTVHATGSVSAWDKFPGQGTQQLAVQVTADCTVHVTAIGASGWQRIAVHGTFRQAGKRPEAIDTHWVFFGSSRRNGSNGQYRFWERSAATRGRWKVLPSSLVVQEPAYRVYLASGGLCGVSFSRVIPVTHYRYLGEATVGGRASWHVRGRSTGSDGEFFDQQLFIDQRTFLVDRAGLIYREPVNGRVVARQNSLMTYSGFNQPLKISAPRIGASTP